MFVWLEIYILYFFTFTLITHQKVNFQQRPKVKNTKTENEEGITFFQKSVKTINRFFQVRVDCAI